MSFLAIFHDSTVRALRYYNEEGWSTTAQFVAFISDIWKILNVKSINKGSHPYSIDCAINNP